MIRWLLGFAALPLMAAPAAAKEPRQVTLYASCVLDAFRSPGEEVRSDYYAALDLAKAQCGNLRPAAIEAIKKHFGKKLTSTGDDPEGAAQALLDILVGEQTAEVWAIRHPDNDSHAH